MNRSSLMRALTLAALVAAYVGAAQWALAANSFYNASGTPAQGSALSSAAMRAEFAAIGAGFDKLPALTANTAIVVNGTGTGLGNTVGTLALAGNFATTGAFNTTFVQQASATFTLPAATDTLVGRASTDTLTNKSISGSANTITNIGNGALTNSSVTIGSTSVSLGGTAATIAGVTLTAPVMTAPVLGTPASGTLTNATGYLVSNLTGLGTGVATFLATPSSANLLSALTTSTGTGNAVFSTAPALTNPTVGTQAANDNSTKAASTAYVDTLFVSGTFTPTDASGAGLIFTSPVGYYRQIGKVMYVWGSFTYPTTANGSNAKIGGLPVASANLSTNVGGFVGTVQFGGGGGTPGGAAPNWLTVIKNSTTMVFAWGGGTALTNANLSTYSVDFYASYPL